MIERIPMSAPEIDPSDEHAVLDVLRSGRLSLGPKIVAFEEAIREYVGVRYVVAVSSGTAALHLIVRGLALGAGDEVLLPSFSFAASVNALLYEHITPVFCDIDPRTYNIDPAALENKINAKTRAILAVDVFGHPADWAALEEIAARHGLKLIDDACEALGAEYQEKKIGQFGKAAAFAFYPNKQITTGEGGVIVTNDPELTRVARCLRNQGRGEMGSWLEHDLLGFNYRMDELSAALGLSQLERIDRFLQSRERVAELYNQRLRAVPGVQLPFTAPHVRKSWFAYVITLHEQVDRSAVIQALEDQQIPSRCYFAPLHLQPYLSGRLPCRKGQLPVTESVASRTLALPFHNRLSVSEVDEIVGALQDAIVRGYASKKNACGPR